MSSQFLRTPQSVSTLLTAPRRGRTTGVVLLPGLARHEVRSSKAVMNAVESLAISTCAGSILQETNQCVVALLRCQQHLKCLCFIEMFLRKRSRWPTAGDLSGLQKSLVLRVCRKPHGRCLQLCELSSPCEDHRVQFRCKLKALQTAFDPGMHKHRDEPWMAHIATVY